MNRTSEMVQDQFGQAPILTRQPRRWSLPHYLVLLGVPFLFFEVWTVTAWLLDGPSQVTEYRDVGSASWWAARVWEGIAITIAILVIAYLVHGCRREHRLFTFDVMFCLAGATIWWSDMGANFLQLNFLESSNWINLNNTCGHIPLIVNPDCGRLPDPLLFDVILETFGYMGLSLICAGIIRRARDRWPGISTPKLMGVVLLSTVIFDLILEPGTVMQFELWSYTGSPANSLSLGNGVRYAFVEILCGGICIGLFVSLRLFTDDRGRTICERGLERYSLRRQRLITFGALYGIFQFLAFVVAGVPFWFVGPGPYADSWEKLPAHLVNGVCDAPGNVPGTRFGPCPGSPGYRMPGRHSLPGESP